MLSANPRSEPILGTASVSLGTFPNVLHLVWSAHDLFSRSLILLRLSQCSIIIIVLKISVFAFFTQSKWNLQKSVFFIREHCSSRSQVRVKICQVPQSAASLYTSHELSHHHAGGISVSSPCASLWTCICCTHLMKRSCKVWARLQRFNFPNESLPRQRRSVHRRCHGNGLLAGITGSTPRKGDVLVVCVCVCCTGELNALWCLSPHFLCSGEQSESRDIRVSLRILQNQS